MQFAYSQNTIKSLQTINRLHLLVIKHLGMFIDSLYPTIFIAMVSLISTFRTNSSSSAYLHI